MKGEIISTQFKFEVKYEEDGVRKYLAILPEIDTSNFKIGDEVEFEKVVKLKEGATYTTTEGWNVDPVEGEYANIIWIPTLYWKIENAIIRWNNDGTQTAGSLTREIMELIKGETWEEIEEEYLKDEYPVFGGPFTNAKTPWEWLKTYFKSPKRK
jgi:hypothetical protein